LKKGVLDVNWKLESTQVLVIIWCASMTSEQMIVDTTFEKLNPCNMC